MAQACAKTFEANSTDRDSRPDAAAGLRAVADQNAVLAVRCLAAAERAVDEGRFNTAKVLRASALACRARALIIERALAAGHPAADLIDTLDASLEHEIELLRGIDSRSAATALDAAVSLRDVIAPTQRSLAGKRDVSETEVAQLLWGCHECGYIAQAQRPDVCPACGSIAGDFELFAPFFSTTSERIARRQPAEIITLLRGAPDALAASLQGATPAALEGKPAPGEWCAKEIAGHMIDIAELFCRRMRALLDPAAAVGAERTPLPWKLLEGQGYENMSVETLTSRFSAAIAAALSIIVQLDDGDWRKKAELAGGKVAVIDLGSWLANHNTAHTEQIKMRRQDDDTKK